MSEILEKCYNPEVSITSSVVSFVNRILTVMPTGSTTNDTRKINKDAFSDFILKVRNSHQFLNSFSHLVSKIITRISSFCPTQSFQLFAEFSL